MTALDLTAPDETTTPASTGDASSDARQNLIDYASLGGFTLSADTHAWYAAVGTVGSPEAARAASTVLAELRGRDLPATRATAARLTEETTLGGLDSVVAVGKALALTLRVRSTLTVLTPTAYESDQLATLAAATASGRWRKEQDAKLTFGQRLNLGRVARSLAVTKRPRRSTLHAALVAAAVERTDWAAISPTGDRPALPADVGFLDASAQAVDAACEALAELGRLQVDSNPAALSLDALGDLVDRLASDEGTLHRLPALRALRESLEEQGYAGLLAELTTARADAEAVAEAIVREFGTVDPAKTAEAEGAETEETPAAEEVATPEEAAAEVRAEAPQALVPAPREEDSTVAETVSAEVPAPAAEATEATADDVEAAEAEAGDDKAAAAEVVEVEAEVAVEIAEIEVEAAEVEVTDVAEVDTAHDVAAEAVTEPVPIEVTAVEVTAVAPEAAEVPAEVPAVAVAEPAADEAPRAPRRPRKPVFTPGRPVTAYSAEDLLSVVQWIDSDGEKRTDDELLRAAMKELGFARLGPRIKESLGAAVTTARS